ncbi:SH3 domain-containing protein [Streptomyces sp. NPDC059398]|uniref:SH3 domain-containing protein n=1 Tax=Streptomyces sp. NPDC059398 TaxID=3346820 RepID=UPI00369F7663
MDIVGATIHSGPGAGYSAKGTLQRSQTFDMTCSTKNSAGHRWYYGQVDDVVNGKGMTGWIYSAGLS